LIEVLEQFMVCSSHSMDSFNDPLAKSNSILIDIKREIELLKYINIYGRIESQKDDEVEFIVIFDNLKALVLESEKEIDELFNLILQFKNDKNFIYLHLKDAKEYIESLKNILLKGK